MLKIAITGNIASGKSQVEKFISEKYTVYDADKIAHQILGNVDRKKLGEKVFSDRYAAYLRHHKRTIGNSGTGNCK